MTRPTGAEESCDGGENQDWSTWRGSQQCRNTPESGPPGGCGTSGSELGGEVGGICIIIEGHGEKMTR